jgi:hypothetical protein
MLPVAHYSLRRQVFASCQVKIVSAYRSAIDRTTDTIDRRARYFRNLIVIVVSVALVSIVSAVIARAFWPLACSLLLLPICGFFFVLDSKLLDHWRSHLLETWVKKDIDFRALCGALNAVPKLPRETVRSMLATLPSAGDLLAEQRISSSTREAVAVAVTGIHGRQSNTVALKASAAAIVSTSVIVAMALRMWEPLLGNLVVLLLPIFGAWLKRRRMDVTKKRTLAARAKPDFSKEKYGQLVKSLPSVATDTSLR